MLRQTIFVDECLFGMPLGLQKCMKLIKPPKFRNKFGEPGVTMMLHTYDRIFDDMEIHYDFTCQTDAM